MFMLRLSVLGCLRADDAFGGMRHVALNLGEAVRMSASIRGMLHSVSVMPFVFLVLFR